MVCITMSNVIFSFLKAVLTAARHTGQGFDFELVFSLVNICTRALLGPITIRIVKSMRPILAFLILTLFSVAVYMADVHLALTVYIPSKYERLPRTPEYEFIFAFTEDHHFPTDCIYQMETTEVGYESDLLGGESLHIGIPIIQKHSKRELLALLAYEMGHRAHYDTVTRDIIILLKIALEYGIAIFIVIPNPLIYRSFGFETEPIGGAFAIAPIIMAIFSLVFKPLQSTSDLNKVYRADAYSASLGYGDYLSKYLVTQTPSVTTRAFEYFYLDHPSTVNRLEYISTIQGKKDPKFYSV